MSVLHHPRVQQHARRHLLCRVEGVPGRFALTFDDGPSPTWTPRVLDLLRARGARATFFVLGPNVRRHPDLARRALAEGHELGVHGEWHLPPPLVPRAWIAWEIRRGERAIERATGVTARLYRPPFGVMTPAQSRWLRGRGYLPVLGDVYPRDVERPGVERIVARVTARLTAGSVLILHDSTGLGDGDRGQSLAAAQRILDWAASRGLAATSVGGLLAVPGAKPDLALAAPADAGAE